MSDMRSGIENTLYRYAWTYDMDELDGIAECFTIDAEVQFRDTGLKVGRDAVADVGLEGRRHLLVEHNGAGAQGALQEAEGVDVGAIVERHAEHGSDP